MTTQTYADPAKRYAGNEAQRATIALAHRFPQVYADLCAAIDKQAETAIDPSEAAAVARLGIGAQFTALLASDDEPPTWTNDPDERRAYTWTAARTLTARVAAAQARNAATVASLEALGKEGESYDPTTDERADLTKTTTPRPDAVTRQTAADTLGGMAERCTTTKQHAALHLIERADAEHQAWQAAEAQRLAEGGTPRPGRRPTPIAALGLALDLKPNSPEWQRLRKVYAAAIETLAPLALDSLRDAWHVGTKATSERPRNWTPEGKQTAVTLAARIAQEAAWQTYLTPYAAHDEAPSPVVTLSPTHGLDGRTRLEVVAASGRILAGSLSPEGADSEAWQAWQRKHSELWLSTHDHSSAASPYADAEAARDARRAEKSPHAGIDRAPAVDRTQESRSHKAPQPRKRSRGGQTGPTVPVRLSR